MDELYTLGYFDKDGTFKEYVRKGRTHSIFAYDNLSRAKRGKSQCPSKNVKIIKFVNGEVVVVNE